MADSEAAICNLALFNGSVTNLQLDSLADPTSVEARVLAAAYPLKRDLLFEKYKKWSFTQGRAYPAQLGGALYDPAHTYAVGDTASFAPNSSLVANMPRCGSSTFVYVSLAGGNLGHEPDAAPTFWRQISRPEWACIFQLPADVIEVHGVYPDLRNPREDQKVPYAIEYEPSPGPGKILLTDGGWPGLAGSSLQRKIGLVYTRRVVDPTMFSAGFVDALSWELAINVCTSILKDAEKAIDCKKQALISFNDAVANDKRQQQQHEPPPVPSWIAARFSGGRHRR